MANRLLILDTASLYYRAFYGLPSSLRAGDGTPVNALRGTLDFMSILCRDYAPGTVAAAWDEDWRPEWRVHLLHSYKTHRLAADSATQEDTPGELVPQVPLIREALRLLHVPVLGCPEAEADDVIGSVTAHWAGPVDIATGDRDLFQLVDDHAARRVLYTARGVKNHRVVDEAAVLHEYGIAPQQYADYAVLRGDPSDGIPGVPGVGAKTAARLITQFGDLAGIRTAVQDDHSEVAPRLRTALRGADEYLAVGPRIIGVRRDLDVTPVHPRAELTDRDRERFTRFGDEWNLGSVTQRALAALDQ